MPYVASRPAQGRSSDETLTPNTINNPNIMNAKLRHVSHRGNCSAFTLYDISFFHSFIRNELL